MEIVLDNNVLFSLMNTSSAASYIFFFLNPAKIFAPEFIKSEFSKHKELCLLKSKLSEHGFELRQKEVEEKINFVNSSEYKQFLKSSLKALPDPDDVDFLALALSIQKRYSSRNSVIWSNDPHLKQQSLVKVFTTADLLIKLLDNEI